MYIVAGSKKGHPLAAPKGTATRPTSARLRETVFNMCQHAVKEARFLDLFAGSGAMGLEALSRGAKQCVFVDSSKAAIVAIKQNVHALGFQSGSRVVFGDVFVFLSSVQHAAQFDVIFIDPPYAKEDQLVDSSYSAKVLQLIDSSQLLAPGGWLFIEDVYKDPPRQLSRLTLESSRRCGRAMLHQFQAPQAE